MRLFFWAGVLRVRCLLRTRNNSSGLRKKRDRILNPILQGNCNGFVQDDINAASGKKIAAQRHAFMETYLQQFYNEWDGLV